MEREAADFIQKRIGLYYGAVLILLVTIHLARTFADADLWGVMATGALLDQNPGFFPYRDLFSYTAWQRPWVYHEWGSGVLFFQVFKAWGSGGLLGLSVGLMTLILGINWWTLWQTVRRQKLGISPEAWLLSFTGFCLAFAFLMSSHLMLLRCQLLTFLCYGLFLGILQVYRFQRKTLLLLALPPIMLLWANLHGGFILGFVLLAVYAGEFLWRREWRPLSILLITMLACLGASLINPYGLDFYRQMFSAWHLARTEVTEWANVIVASWYWGLIYTGLLVFFLSRGLWHWRNNRQEYPLALILLAATGIEGWLHFKLSAIFLLTALAVGFELPMPRLSRLTQEPAIWRRIATFCTMIPVSVILASGVILFLSPSPSLKVPGNDNPFPMVLTPVPVYPVGAVAYLRERQQEGNLWLPFDWGEFALWNLFPRMRVSMDGRYETVYDDATFQDNARFFNHPFDLARLKRYPETTHLLIPANHKPLIDPLRKDPQWRLCYQDDVGLIFSRQLCPVVIIKKQGNPTRDLNVYRGDLTRFRLKERDFSP